MDRHDHLLIKLIEECAEVQQRATKALRFGLNEKQPGQERDNRHRLYEEIVDLKTVLILLEREKIYADNPAHPPGYEKIIERINRYFKYSEEQRRVTPQTEACSLAKEVFDTIMQSYPDRDVPVDVMHDLASLMGAILDSFWSPGKGRICRCDWDGDRPIVKRLQTLFGAGHDVWDHIDGVT